MPSARGRQRCVIVPPGRGPVRSSSLQALCKGRRPFRRRGASCLVVPRHGIPAALAVALILCWCPALCGGPHLVSDCALT
eukprot:12771788-Alexandrium_andersonii.AAC.1